VTSVADPLSASESASGEPPFHLTRAWFAAWDAAYLGDARPLEAGGMALLDTRARIGPLAYRLRRSRTNVHTPRFGPLAYPAPAVADIRHALLGGSGVDVAMVDNLPEDSPVLAAARAAGLTVAAHALAPVVDCRQPYAAWLARRSKRVRYRWPRQAANVTGTLGMRFESHERFADLPSLLAEIFKVEASGWKGRAGTAIADSAADTLFYTRLAHLAAAAGALRISVLRQGDRITAFEYGILAGDRLFLLKVGYDEAFEDASLGHVLAAMNIAECCADPRIAWYDKLGNGMTPAPYKLRFADRCDTLWRVTAYAPTWRGQAVRLHDALRARAKLARDAWRQRQRTR
jgi:CelD/BcsL family acetyltransferase involved in cellulose biosynthesis